MCILLHCGAYHVLYTPIDAPKAMSEQENNKMKYKL